MLASKHRVCTLHSNKAKCTKRLVQSPKQVYNYIVLVLYIIRGRHGLPRMCAHTLFCTQQMYEESVTERKEAFQLVAGAPTDDPPRQSRASLSKPADMHTTSSFRRLTRCWHKAEHVQCACRTRAWCSTHFKATSSSGNRMLPNKTNYNYRH